MRKFILLGLIVSHAQANDAADTALQDELNYLQAERYVYAAAKHNQPISKAPASISIVTAEQIKKYGYRTLGEIIDSLKGFYYTYNRAYGKVGSRGFFSPNDLLLLIDGHRFNENLFDSFDSSEAFPLDVDSIERVEVVRGPGSALYGSNAVFGVINVITKRGGDLKGGNMKSSYGSFDAIKNSVSYGKKLENGLEGFVTGSFYHTPGHERLYYSEFNQRDTNYGVSENNDEDESKKLLATINYQDFTIQGVFDRRNKNLPTAPFGTVFNSPNTKIADESMYVDLKYEHTFSNQLNLLSRFSYNHFIYRGKYPFYDPDLSKIADYKTFTGGKWWRGEIEASKTLFNDHRITLGGEFQHNFEQLIQDYYNNIDAGHRNLNSYKWAVFLQDEYSITQDLTLNLGVRYDYFSYFGDTINPRAGLIYNFMKDNTFKLLYGSAFRPPNVVDVVDVGPLQPESYKTLEFIFEHRFNSYLSSEINVFHTMMTDLIRNYSSGTVTEMRNIGEVNATGVEAQLEGNWANGWQTRLSYSWQDTMDEHTQQHPNNSPVHMVKFNLIAPLWQDKLFLGFETRYMSSQKTIHVNSQYQSVNGRVDDFVISNLTLLSREWPAKGLELSGGVYNLFDQRYFHPGASSTRQNGIEQDGLTFRIKASLDF